MVKKAPGLNRGWPTIVIVNKSRHISTARLRKALRAIQKQVDRDFFPVWGWRAKLSLRDEVSPSLMNVTIVEQDPDKGGDAGYHVDETGIPQAYVFTEGVENDDQEVFATLSHEVLEMIADPALNLYASTFRKLDGKRQTIFVGIEVCDAVQYCLYEIDGIKVSDFVVPEWFEAERPAGSMRFSFKDNVAAPLALAEGGYMDVVVKGKLGQVGGAKGKARHRLRERQRLLTGQAPARKRPLRKSR